jgi:hypothetical protein
MSTTTGICRGSSEPSPITYCSDSRVPRDKHQSISLQVYCQILVLPYIYYLYYQHATIECSQKLSASSVSCQINLTVIALIYIFYLLRKSLITLVCQRFCNLNLWNVLLLNIICDKWKFQTFNQLTCLEHITCCSNSIFMTL